MAPALTAHAGARAAVRATVLVLSFVPALAIGRSGAQTPEVTERALRLVADGVLASATFMFVDTATGQRYVDPADAPEEAVLRPESPYTDWRYWNGVLNIAMLRLADVLDEQRYADFARHSVAFSFDHVAYFRRRYHGEDKWSYPFGQRFTRQELDDYGAEGASVIDVYALEPDPRYRSWLDSAAEYASDRQGSLPDGTFARAFPRRWTVWADDLYMSVPFLARMAALSGVGSYLDDAVRQVINFHARLFDPRAGLMAHNWYSGTGQRGVAFWGRANGWALMAQVELLDLVPSDLPQRDRLLALLRQHVVGIARYQDGSGLWHQLLDRPDSYLETSASAMFVFAIARAVSRGWIERRYAAIARRGWSGVMTRIRPDGQIEGVCAGTAVSDSLSDYYHRPTPLNDPHGVGAVLLAGSEVLRLRP